MFSDSSGVDMGGLYASFSSITRHSCGDTRTSSIHHICMANTIHSRIRDLRLEKGWSQEKLALECGYKSWQTVQQWENGKTAPNRKKLPIVAKKLNTTSDYLMSGDPSQVLQRPTEKKVTSADFSHTDKYAGIIIEKLRLLDDDDVDEIIEIIELKIQKKHKYKKQNAR